MDVLAEAIAWLNDPLNWTGRNGVLALTRDHIVVSVLAVLARRRRRAPGRASGWATAARGGTVGVVVANTTRALPTLALLTLLAASGLFGNTATVLACAVFAVPPLLTNTVTGLGEVDADVRDAARGVGHVGPPQPLGRRGPARRPADRRGIRTASVQVLATVPLAALVGGRSLGTIVVTGFGTQDYGQVLAGGILVAALCLVSEGLLAIVQHLMTPRGLRALARDTSDDPSRRTRRSRGTSPGVAEPAASGSNRSGPSS